MNALGIIDLRNSLAQASADDSRQPAHARAFAAWIQNEDPSRALLLKALAEEAAGADGAARQTVHASVLGYGLSLDSAFKAPFVAALEWIRQREYFVVGRPLTFEVDGLGLFGVAIGIASLEDESRVSAKTWLQKLLRQSLASRRPSDWNGSLIAAALAIIGDGTGIDNWGDVSCDLQAALAAKAFLPMTAVDRSKAWDIISELRGSTDGMTRAAAQVTALAYQLRDSSTLRFGSVSTDDVARLLAGVDRSMRRWVWESQPRTKSSAIARWDIENEYHVQDLLWAILAPVFPDLDDEEWLKSLGQHHPRADLAIPSLELIIEVKFLRSGGKSVFSSVIQEVAADASTYLQSGSGFRDIIAFVWDDLARTEEHPELRQGLMRIRGVTDAIVLSRPAKMERHRPTSVTPDGAS